MEWRREYEGALSGMEWEYEGALSGGGNMRGHYLESNGGGNWHYWNGELYELSGMEWRKE